MKLETAQKLKDAGLPWMPELLDTYVFTKFLEEIEARGYIGYMWLLEKENAEYVHGKYCFSICNTNGHKPKWNDFHADSPEEAAAQALLWILEQEEEAKS